MKCLEELGFPHEAGQGARPTFAEHVNPLEIDPGELDLWAARRLAAQRLPLRSIRGDEFHKSPSIGLDKAAGGDAGATDGDPRSGGGGGEAEAGRDVQLEWGGDGAWRSGGFGGEGGEASH